jgi:hypothetical protein
VPGRVPLSTALCLPAGDSSDIRGHEWPVSSLSLGFDGKRGCCSSDGLFSGPGRPPGGPLPGARLGAVPPRVPLALAGSTAAATARGPRSCQWVVAVLRAQWGPRVRTTISLAIKERRLPDTPSHRHVRATTTDDSPDRYMMPMWRKAPAPPQAQLAAPSTLPNSRQGCGACSSLSELTRAPSRPADKGN